MSSACSQRCRTDQRAAGGPDRFLGSGADSSPSAGSLAGWPGLSHHATHNRSWSSARLWNDPITGYQDSAVSRSTSLALRSSKAVCNSSTITPSWRTRVAVATRVSTARPASSSGNSPSGYRHWAERRSSLNSQPVFCSASSYTFVRQISTSREAELILSMVFAAWVPGVRNGCIFPSAWDSCLSHCRVAFSGTDAAK